MENEKPPATPATPAISPVAHAVLELGRGIVTAAQGHGVFRTSSTPAKATIADPAAAVAVIRGMKDARGMFTFRDGEPDMGEVKAFAVVAWLSLMSDHHPDVLEVSALVAGDPPSPADVMAARVSIRNLCVRDVLRFTNGAHKRWNGVLSLSIRTVKILGLLTRAGPIFSEKALLFERGVAAYGGVVGEGDAEADVEPEPAKGSAAAYIPPADVIRIRIRETVIGGYLEEPIRAVSAAYNMHMHRAAMIRRGKHPGTPNVVALLIGSSSTGKTFLCESAARTVNGICGGDLVPFASFSATDLTAEGYVGCSVEDIVKPLLDRCGWDPLKARFGCAFLDEIDKKACRTDRGSIDVSGRSVQEGLLRILGGSVFPVGGRRVSWDQRTAQFDSCGTMFFMAGAFVGLEKLTGRVGSRIGFGDADPKREPRLRDCLVEFGLIPELVSRIGSIITIRDPGLKDMIEICTSPGGLLFCYSKLWQGMGLKVAVTPDGIKSMAGYGIDTAAFARGMQSILNRATERLVYDGGKAVIRLGAREIRGVIDSMEGLA